MQDARVRDPPIEEGNEAFPPHISALAAAYQDVMPQSVNALSEEAQLVDVPGNGVVLVIPSDDLPEPCTDLAGAIMLPAAELRLDGFKLRNHPLFRSNPPDASDLGRHIARTRSAESSPGGVRGRTSPAFP